MKDAVPLIRKDGKVFYRKEVNGVIYLVKYFTEFTSCSLPIRKKRLEQSETIARLVRDHGFNAVCAICKNGQYIQQDGNRLFAVYPWIDGTVYNEEEVDPSICEYVGTFIGELHKLNLKDPTIHSRRHSVANYQGGYSNCEVAEVHDAIELLNNYAERMEELSCSDLNLCNSPRNILTHRDSVLGNIIFPFSICHLSII